MFTIDLNRYCSSDMMMKNAYIGLEDSAVDSIIVTLISPMKKDRKYVPRN